MSSSPTRRHVFLLNKKRCLLVEEEKDMYSCQARRHVFLLGIWIYGYMDISIYVYYRYMDIWKNGYKDIRI